MKSILVWAAFGTISLGTFLGLLSGIQSTTLALNGQTLEASVTQASLSAPIEADMSNCSTANAYVDTTGINGAPPAFSCASFSNARCYDDNGSDAYLGGNSDYQVGGHYYFCALPKPLNGGGSVSGVPGGYAYAATPNGQPKYTPTAPGSVAQSVCGTLPSDWGCYYYPGAGNYLNTAQSPIFLRYKNGYRGIVPAYPTPSAAPLTLQCTGTLGNYNVNNQTYNIKWTATPINTAKTTWQNWPAITGGSLPDITWGGAIKYIDKSEPAVAYGNVGATNAAEVNGFAYDSSASKVTAVEGQCKVTIPKMSLSCKATPITPVAVDTDGSPTNVKWTTSIQNIPAGVLPTNFSWNDQQTAPFNKSVLSQFITPGTSDDASVVATVLGQTLTASCAYTAPKFYMTCSAKPFEADTETTASGEQMSTNVEWTAKSVNGGGSTDGKVSWTFGSANDTIPGSEAGDEINAYTQVTPKKVATASVSGVAIYGEGSNAVSVPSNDSLGKNQCSIIGPLPAFPPMTASCEGMQDESDDDQVDWIATSTFAKDTEDTIAGYTYKWEYGTTTAATNSIYLTAKNALKVTAATAQIVNVVNVTAKDIYGRTKSAIADCPAVTLPLPTFSCDAEDNSYSGIQVGPYEGTPIPVGILGWYASFDNSRDMVARFFGQDPVSLSSALNFKWSGTDGFSNTITGSSNPAFKEYTDTPGSESASVTVSNRTASDGAAKLYSVCRTENHGTLASKVIPRYLDTVTGKTQQAVVNANGNVIVPGAKFILYSWGH